MSAKPFVLSNLDVYFSIAKDALAKSKKLEGSQRTPKPDGTRFVITHDPDRRSFKHSLIAIVFAGIFLDALLHIEGKRRLGRSKYRKLKYEKMPYAKRLKTIGIDDEKLLMDCERFRQSRNDLVHEKAIEIWPSTKTRQQLRTAQEEAQHAMSFIQSLVDLLKYGGQPQH
jgi:hypothetical protein